MLYPKMSQTETIYFHIGFPKTASSFLQNKIFCKNQKINYIGIPEKKNWGVEEWYLYNFLLFLFTSNNEIFYNDLDKHILNLNKIKISQDKVNIISHDSLTNSIYLFSFDIYESLKRIKLTFDSKLNFKIKIFFSIRNQSDMILSFYSQFYRRLIKKNKEWKKFKSFLAVLEAIYEKKIIKDNDHLKIFNNFCYFSFYNFLVKNFSSSNIKVLLYEDLLNDPQFYFNEIQNFLKISNLVYKDNLNKNVNKSNIIDKFEYERKFIPIHKTFKQYINNQKINKIIYRMLTHDKVVLNAQDKRLIKNYYLDDNLNMNHVLNNQLKKYDYFLN